MSPAQLQPRPSPFTRMDELNALIRNLPKEPRMDPEVVRQNQHCAKRDWRLRNSDRQREMHRAWYAAHRDERRAAMRKYHQDHREELIRKMKEKRRRKA